MMKALRLLAILTPLLLTACGGGDNGSGADIPVEQDNNNDTGDDNSSGDGNLGGDYGEGTTPNPTLEAPIFRNIGVHDPSVIRTQDGEYYVFGSHLSAAKTSDLTAWTRVADGVTDSNPLFDTYASQAAEGITWTDDFVGSWAADVIQLADGKYYFYYNHCAQGPEGNCVSRSYMGIATSESVDGPYINQQLFLKTGHRPEDGFDIEGDGYDGNSDPNAIDPDVFYGKDGKLWLVYGSYSGGIFIKELDTATGLPIDNSSYGTKITGGFYASIEGPFMFYSPESDYYYIFLSYGGYDQKGGYNLRVARSKTPQGPYLDAAGQDIISASGSFERIAPYGNKVIGGFNFKSGLGMSGSDYGYMAPGHGSAHYDEETGKNLLFFHTRFPNRGEQHEVRVHEMFVTEDDWLVVAPHRYTDIQGDNIVDEEDIIGTYQFINHEKDINKEVKQSTYITLDSEGGVSGALTGSYTIVDNKLTITTDEGTSYKGVASWQWHEQEQLLTPTFAAQSGDGTNIWGSEMPFVDYKSALTAIIEGIELPDATIFDLNLPTEGILGATLTWSSSEPGVISTSGEIVQGAADQTVTLTVTVDLDGNSDSKEFTIVVKASDASGLTAHYAFEQNLSDSNNVFAAAQTTADTYDTAGGQALYTTGVNGHAFDFNGQTGVTLPSTLIGSNSYSVSIWLRPTVLTQFTAAFFAGSDSDSWLSLVPMSWDNQTMLWSNNNDTWFDGVTNSTIPVNQWSHMVMTNDGGQVSLYIDGVLLFSGDSFPDLFSSAQADILLGINYFEQDTLFQGQIDEVKIFNRPLTPDEVSELFTEFN